MRSAGSSDLCARPRDLPLRTARAAEAGVSASALGSNWEGTGPLSSLVICAHAVWAGPGVLQAEGLAAGTCRAAGAGGRVCCA